jgi:catechol 2,3-dioxygenase-like lactoylglutathione lyase family enzyme
MESSRDVIVRTEAFDEAVRFYGNVLGLRPLTEPLREGLAGFEAGGFRLFVEKGPPHGPVFEFLAPDLRSARSRLIGAGCVLVEENPAIPRIYLRDPYGMVFNLESL